MNERCSTTVCGDAPAQVTEHLGDRPGIADRRAGARREPGALARAVALADNGHTNVSPISRRARVNALPLRLAWFSDGLFVLQATQANEDLLGARIELISGLTPEQLAELRAAAVI